MGLRVVLYLGGELVYDFFFYRGSVYSFEGCSENFMYFLFFFVYISLLCTGLVTILLHTLYFIFIYKMMMYVFLHLPLHVLFLFPFYTHVSLCMQSLFLFHT